MPNIHISMRPWRQQEVIFLLERLHLYVSAGLSLDGTLEAIAEGFAPRQRRQRRSVGQMLIRIRSGGSLSVALRDCVGLDASSAAFIAHGEASGALAAACRSAYTLLERRNELKRKVLSAMTYPVVIGVFAGGLTIGLIRGVMPQILPMLESLHVPLPLLTRVVVWVSGVLIAYGSYALAGLVVTVILGKTLYRRFEAIRKISHHILSAVPVVGSLARQYALAVFLHSFGSLVESGLPVGTAYADTARTIPFYPVRAAVGSRADSISRGSSVGSSLRLRIVPAHICSLIAAGEASGTLGASIIRAAEILDRDMEHSLKRLTSLVEPVMMAGMGVIVGAIAMAIMMPIYDISKVLQH